MRMTGRVTQCTGSVRANAYAKLKTTMTMTRNRTCKLVAAKLQILDAIRWDGSGVCMEDIAEFLGEEYGIAMNTMTTLEITRPEGDTKWVEVGNFVAINEMGKLILLTNHKVDRDFKIL